MLVMALATGVSRLFGLVREVAIADRFGASGVYDAFLIAFFAPHFLRQLLAEGALSTAFVPVYTRLRVRGDDADRFASNLLSFLIVVFPVTVVLGVFLAPYYVPFLASGFPPDKATLAISLARVVFPFIALIGFAAVFMGILNSHRRFFAASFAPVWFNVGMILGALVFPRFLFPEQPVFGLTLGVLLGGGGQLLSQLPSVRSVGFRFRFRLFPVHPGIREMIRRLSPAIVALAVAQVNLLVDNKIASHLGDGSIASLQYAMRLFQLPLGVFAVSIATALLPRFSAAQARGEEERFSRYLSDGVATSAFVLLPAMVGLLLIGPDVVRLLFEHGSFSGVDALRTSHALSYYLVGLLPYGLVYVQTRACYAQGRTVLPLLASAGAVGTNVALDLLLVGVLRESGLALATGIAGVVNAGVLFLFLWTKIRGKRTLLGNMARIALGTALLAGVVCGIQRVVEGAPPVVRVFVPMLGAIVFYLAYARVSGLGRSLGGGLRPSLGGGAQA
jgi:putative peptidoglycan lipid II flippase